MSILERLRVPNYFGSFWVRKFVYRQEKIRRLFLIRARILSLQPDCNDLFDFRDFESSCGVAPRGGYSDSSGRTSTKIGDSKTKPRQEKKPESNRSSGVVIRCNDLIIRQFRVPKTALRSTK